MFRKKLNLIMCCTAFIAALSFTACSSFMNTEVFQDDITELSVESRAVTKSETIKFSSLGYTANTNLTSVKGSYGTLTFSTGSGTSAPLYYKKNSCARLYKSNTLTVSSTSYNISKIVFTFRTSPASGVISANTGTYSYSSKTWTGSSKSICFTNNVSSGNTEITSIAITYEDSSSNSSSSSGSSSSGSTSTNAYSYLGKKGYLNSTSYIDSSYTKISYSDNNPLLLGNPSKATKNSSYSRNYLLEKSQYTLSYNNTNHIPNWVAWHLDSSDLGSATRYSGNFFADTSLPSSYYKVLHSDYTNSGFDRGHMCPSADRTSSSTNNKATFATSNIVPQTANNNQKIWNYLEDYERNLAQNGKELYIYSGSYGQGGENSSGTKLNYVSWPSSNSNAPSDSGILVPAYTWKIILAIDKGSGDLNRITASNATVIAVNVPNTVNCYSNATSSYSGSNSWKYYITTVDAIESLTGYDFFTNLSASVESALESKKFTN